MQPIIGLGSGRRMVAWSAGESRAHVLHTTYTWHPEWLGRDDDPSLSLLRTLVAAAGGSSA